MFRSIVVGTDGSDTASQAVRQAVELASAVGATLELVSAYEPVPAARVRKFVIDYSAFSMSPAISSGLVCGA